MNKIDLLKFLEPFDDSIEIAIIDEGLLFELNPKYVKDGFGVEGDEAGIVFTDNTQPVLTARIKP